MSAAADYADRVHDARDLATLESLLSAATRDLGFRFHAMVEHGDLALSPALVALHDYPARWSAVYKQSGLHRIDPVQQAAARVIGGFAWRDLARIIRLTDTQRGLLLRAQGAGLGEGFTVPLHAPLRRSASCSFVTDTGRALPQASLMAAYLLANAAWRRAVQITRSPEIPRTAPLSRRQRECVGLMARGKTDWEIGLILGLSEETVTKYLNAARARYGVTRRTQLAIAVLRDGTLGIDEIDSRQ